LPAVLVKTAAKHRLFNVRGDWFFMRDFNAESREAYNQKADDYDNTADGKFTRKFKNLLLAVMEVKRDDAVLDVACGNGLFLKRLNEKVPMRGFGIDISERMVENAIRNCAMMTFHVAGCEKMPAEAGSMDSITVSAAYHHFPDVDAFAKEAARVLKPQGMIYIAEIYLPFVLRALCNPFLFLTGAGDVKFYSTGEIARTFNGQGFALVKTVKQGYVQVIQMQKR